MRLICQGCGRDMVMDRIKLEKATKKLFPAVLNEESKKEGES